MDSPPVRPSVSWSHLVLNEISAVTACMRRNARWRDALLSTHAHGLLKDSAHQWTAAEMSSPIATAGVSVIHQVPNGGSARPFEPAISSSLRQEVSVSVSAGAGAGAALSTSPLHGPPSSSSSTTPNPSYQRPPSITTEDERRSRTEMVYNPGAFGWIP